MTSPHAPTVPASATAMGGTVGITGAGRRVALPPTTVTEQDLLRGYRRGRDTLAVGTEVLARISELWRYHRWYRTHTGWLVNTKLETDYELRLLLKVARAGRRREPAVGVGYHEWQAGA